jgi:hypothetical protein
MYCTGTTAGFFLRRIFTTIIPATMNEMTAIR